MKIPSSAWHRCLIWFSSAAFLGIVLATNSSAQPDKDAPEEAAEEEPKDKKDKGGEKPDSPHLPPPNSSDTEAKVTIGDDVQRVTENQSVYIPLGAKHRMENPGKVPMVLIEVQTGSYLGEDDIVRYEDIYART